MSQSESRGASPPARDGGVEGTASRFELFELCIEEPESSDVALQELGKDVPRMSDVDAR